MKVERNRSRRLVLVERREWKQGTRPRVVGALLRFPLFYKILVANVAILALVTAACTLIAHRPVGAADRDFALLLFAGVAISIASNAFILRLALSPLKQLEQTALRVQEGDLTARVERSALADRNLDRLAMTFNAMVDSGDAYRRRLRDIAARALGAQEEERKRVSRELHDGAAQTLAALRVRLRVARSAPDDATREQLLDRLSVEMGNATEDLRRIAHALRPAALDMLGLSPAIESYTRTLAETTDMKFHTELSDVDGMLTPEAELALYRIVQESLSNIARHSHATSARISLKVVNRSVEAVIQDDGRGFILTEEMSRGGLGLFGMQERGAYVGARVDIESEPGRGTRIRVTIPVVETARYA